MAGATARRSSMASSPETDSSFSSFPVSFLHRSHTSLRAAMPGSSFRPLGVDSRGKTTAASACRAASQVWTSARASKAADTWRNFSPYPRYRASSPSVRAEADRSRAPQWAPFRRMEVSSSAA